jgi:hypothetical protein
MGRRASWDGVHDPNEHLDVARRRKLCGSLDDGGRVIPLAAILAHVRRGGNDWLEDLILAEVVLDVVHDEAAEDCAPSTQVSILGRIDALFYDASAQRDCLIPLKTSVIEWKLTYVVVAHLLPVRYCTVANEAALLERRQIGDRLSRTGVAECGVSVPRYVHRLQSPKPAGGCGRIERSNMTRLQCQSPPKEQERQT